METIPDFTNKQPMIDPMAIANVLQRRSEIEYKQRQDAQNRRDTLLAGIAPAIEAGQHIASTMMDMAAKRNQAKGLEDLNTVMNTPEPVAPSPMASSSAIPEAGTFPVQPSPEQTDTFQNQVQDRQKAFASALARSNHDEYTKEAIKQQFETPDQPKPLDLQSKQITYNGQPMEALFDKNTGNYYDTSTKQPLTGKITPYGMSSAMAEQRQLSRIDKQAESMGKDLNDAAIGSNSPAGINAKRALYARSGLNLIQQANNQPGGVDKRQMAELQMETARVLTGAGVMTNESLNKLASDTANTKIKNWEEWLTNKPTGLNQQKFVDRFQSTLERQAKLSEKGLEDYKQKTMAKYTAFENQAPKDFQDSLRQAGYDPNIYKKTRKLVPLKENNPVEFEQLKSDITNKKTDNNPSSFDVPGAKGFTYTVRNQ